MRLAALAEAGIVLTPAEQREIEVADFGLSELEQTGLEVVVYVNTERVCAKELVMFPGQTCPEHLHPPFEGTPGKEETFRCRQGRVYLYTEGEPTPAPACRPARADARRLHRLARDRPRARRPAHDPTRDAALVPGRARRRDRLRVLDREPRRARHLHRPRDRAHDRRRRWLARPVVCAGIVVADVFVPPLADLPEPGELVATEDFVVETGGCAANAAMALARLGVRPAVVAKVGDDVFGGFVEHELSAAGIDVERHRPRPGLRHLEDGDRSRER